MSEVYVYVLKRASPLFEPSHKDDWSLMGAFGPEQALKQFAEQVGVPLKPMDDHEFVGEFVLEQYKSIATYGGLSQSIQRGEKVATFWVEHSQSNP